MIEHDEYAYGSGALKREEVWLIASNLGYHPRDVAEIRLLPEAVEVKMLLRNDDGVRYQMFYPETGEVDIAHEWHRYPYGGEWPRGDVITYEEIHERAFHS